METILSGTNTDDVVDVLRSLDILQYFFPEAKDVAVGVVDHGVHDAKTVATALVAAPNIGHPYAEWNGVYTEQAAIDTIEEARQEGNLGGVGV